MFCSVTPMPAALSERLETTVAASARPGTPIFLPLRSAMLLMSLSPGTSSLVQPVCRPVVNLMGRPFSSGWSSLPIRPMPTSP